MQNPSQFESGHASGELTDKLKEMMTYLSIAGSMLFALITLPVMPLIFYMTILFNVIMLVVEYFRDL